MPPENGAVLSGSFAAAVVIVVVTLMPQSDFLFHVYRLKISFAHLFSNF